MFQIVFYFYKKMNHLRGGAMFLEDGVEIGNTFDGNLAVFVQTSSSLLNEDVTPAAIWVIILNYRLKDIYLI